MKNHLPLVPERDEDDFAAFVLELDQLRNGCSCSDSVQRRIAWLEDVLAGFRSY
jgi:hypothetical protein